MAVSFNKYILVAFQQSSAEATKYCKEERSTGIPCLFNNRATLLSGNVALLHWGLLVMIGMWEFSSYGGLSRVCQSWTLKCKYMRVRWSLHTDGAIWFNHSYKFFICCKGKYTYDKMIHVQVTICTGKVCLLEKKSVGKGEADTWVMIPLCSRRKFLL